VTVLDPDLRSLQEVRDCVARAHRAAAIAATWDQARVDSVCEAMVRAASAAAYDLARLAVEETGIGRVHYKVLKNLFGSEGTWASIKDERTVGVIHRDEARGVLEIGTPAGVVAGIVPTTNPTSTAINKALISVKGRNAIVISPHPRAKRCIGETVEVLRAALERQGAPADLVQSLQDPTLESTGALMKHDDVALILATGGSGLVNAAYSSGKPAYGVGPGNVPVYVDRSANVEEAARWIVASQSFDNATLCCSEQALVLDRPVADRVIGEMLRRGAHLCTDEERRRLERFCNVRGHMNPDVVGLDPWRVAELAGFQVPRSTSVLLAEQEGVGREHPLSIEILCPLLSVHRVDGWEEGCEVSLATLRYGGLGHTIGLWARDQTVLDAWFLEKPANRIIVNGPTSQGAVGYSTNLMPAMSLGCGPQAGNITSDNITARHLINVKRVAFPKADWDRLYQDDHARAAVHTGDVTPRGSGLLGDPALGRAGGARAGAHVSTTGLSNWRGNAPSEGPAPTASAGSGASTGARRAPRFTEQASYASTVAPRIPTAGSVTSAAPRPAPPASAPPALTTAPRPQAPGPYVGMALSQDEIQGILAHAGSGCPLGPCKGCPHHEVQTGACLA